MANRRNGDDIKVGDISQAQGIAIGRGARAQASGNTIIGAAQEVDPAELRAALKDLYTALGQANLPEDALIQAQTAAGIALTQGTKDGEVKPDAIVPQIQEIGETLKQANVVVEEGTSLWQSIWKLAPVLGPLVSGGARTVADWFGVALPN